MTYQKCQLNYFHNTSTNCMNRLVNTSTPSAKLGTDWINELKISENKTLKDIYVNHRIPLINQIKRKYNLQDEEAKEIFQLCVIVFYDNVMTGKLDTLSVGLKSYLMGVAHNKVYETYRSKRKEVKCKSAFTSMISSIIQSDTEQTETAQKRIKSIIEGIQHIGDPCRTILQMFYYKNRSIKDITLHFNYKNENTTKSLKYKCVQRIKKYIQLNTLPA